MAAKMNLNVHICQVVQKLDNGRAIVENVPESVLVRPTSCQNLVTFDKLNKMTRSEMMGIISEKHGIMFHRMCDTCTACGDYCKDREIIIRNDAGLMSASCCDKKECEIITRALLLGGYGFVPMHNEQNISNIKVKRTSGAVEDNWKIIYFDADTMRICVRNATNTLSKGIPAVEFHVLNPTIQFDLRYSPIDVIKRARELPIDVETGISSATMFLFPNV